MKQQQKSVIVKRAWSWVPWWIKKSENFSFSYTFVALYVLFFFLNLSHQTKASHRERERLMNRGGARSLVVMNTCWGKLPRLLCVFCGMHRREHNEKLWSFQLSLSFSHSSPCVYFLDFSFSNMSLMSKAKHCEHLNNEWIAAEVGSQS